MKFNYYGDGAYDYSYDAPTERQKMLKQTVDNEDLKLAYGFIAGVVFSLMAVSILVVLIAWLFYY